MPELINPYVFIPLIAWLLAQLIKFIAQAWRGNINFRLFYSSGGMPSAHTALVSALVITTLVYEGFASPLFGVSAVFAGVVMYDSFGVRRSSGNQAVVINALIDKLDKGKFEDGLHIKNVLGHKPLEVVAGVVLGVLTAGLLTYQKLPGSLGFLSGQAFRWEAYAYLCVFGLMLGVSIFNRLALNKKHFVQVASIKQLRRFLGYYFGVFSVVGLVLVLAQLQTSGAAAWRAWVLSLLSIFVVLSAMIWQKWLRHLPAEYKEQVRKRQNIRKNH